MKKKLNEFRTEELTPNEISQIIGGEEHTWSAKTINTNDNCGDTQTIHYHDNGKVWFAMPKVAYQCKDSVFLPI